MDERSWVSEAPCRVRLGEPCRLCVPGATGPQDCGLAYLVMTDPYLCAELDRMRSELLAAQTDLSSVR
ncbi:DUF6767 domain-containing protein [Nocardioides pocheonensis]|uniref:Uncharacterized protein n=1 Tax=Nocardioides pocheonensis TaxID=661485 RepID=A0A3N0GW84_9ACTN|nr:DUF6767 domain-containing protein [Nocardioides pocheonensis]RNM16715.1 hypothetical protein EFL26_04145 [Nocardioides pocheonensis]